MYRVYMIKSFRNAATEDVFHGANSKQARKDFPRELWGAMRKKLDMLNAATSLQDLAALPGTRLEPLKHTKPGYYSIRVNDRFRVTFTFEQGHAFDVAIEDYH
jgi:proteic killer suppression protein